MKALILNSGVGSRMSDMTADNPKCMVELISGETILARQLRQLQSAGIEDVIVTTGYMAETIEKACEPFAAAMRFEFVLNMDYLMTNYIFSIYLAREHLRGDTLLLHGDLVFDDSLVPDVLAVPHNCMTVSRDRPLPEKDFKAVVKDGKIKAVGVQFFDNALYAQPMYKLRREDWEVWLGGIELFCETDKRKCYAEDVFNELSDSIELFPYDVGLRLCMEVDTQDDLRTANFELTKESL